jgi:hypothetical protein
MVRPSHASRTTARIHRFKFHLTFSIITIVALTVSSAATWKIHQQPFDRYQLSIAHNSFALRSPRSGLLSDGRILTASGRTASTTLSEASPGTLGNFATQGLSGATVFVGASNVAANAAFSNLTRGTGLTAASLTNAFNSSGWTTAAMPDANDYCEFTITPNSGFQFSASELRVGLQRSSTGPSNVVLRSSLDEFASNIGPVIAPPSGTTATSTVDLTVVPGLQNSSAPVTFRLYGYGASSGAGTLRIERVTSVPMVGLEVDGTVTEACVAPVVTSHPVDTNVLYGHTAVFTAAADGSGLGSIWEVSADNGATWSSTGVTTPTLSFLVRGVASNGRLYRAVFSNSCGAATSNPARLTVGRKPLF